MLHLYISCGSRAKYASGWAFHYSVIPVIPAAATSSRAGQLCLSTARGLLKFNNPRRRTPSRHPGSCIGAPRGTTSLATIPAQYRFIAIPAAASSSRIEQLRRSTASLHCHSERPEWSGGSCWHARFPAVHYCEQSPGAGMSLLLTQDDLLRLHHRQDFANKERREDGLHGTVWLARNEGTGMIGAGQQLPPQSLWLCSE